MRYQLVGQLYDAAMADFAAEVQASCRGCNGERWRRGSVGMTGDCFKKAQQRKTGLLESHLAATGGDGAAQWNEAWADATGGDDVRRRTSHRGAEARLCPLPK
jgi:hypothetical protein